MLEKNFSKKRTTVIKEIIKLANEKYVYPELGAKITSQLQIKLDGGLYDDIENENSLALRLTPFLHQSRCKPAWRN